MRTLIIGAGPAGMMAAIISAKCGDSVTVLEHLPVFGKKLLSTGNGRCNLTNSYQNDQCYHSETPLFFKNALSEFGYKETLTFFHSLGILTKEKDGYFYPRSMQASSVRSGLEEAMHELGIEMRAEEHVTEILSHFQGGMLAKTKNSSFFADRIILACGGMAAPVLGSDGIGLCLAEKLGHRIIAPVPALTGMKVCNFTLKKASGVRCQATVSYKADEIHVFSDTGELQITDYGISGIPVFQISYAVGRALLSKSAVSVTVDFLPEYEGEEAEKIIVKLCSLDNKTIFSALNGLFPEKLSMCLLKNAGIQPHTPAVRVAEDTIKLSRLTGRIRNFQMEIIETNDFSKAQVTSGGVDCREIDPVTMESRIIPGLYFAGEIMDVDGICGGYNLQWAWSSGYAAGRGGRDILIGD